VNSRVEGLLVGNHLEDARLLATTYLCLHRLQASYKNTSQELHACIDCILLRSEV
jgi:hypothetical protein